MNAALDFSGKNVLVTGGSRGIGRAVSMEFASLGARVAVNYRNDDAAAKTLLEAMPGGPHMMLKADVSKTEEIRDMFERIAAEMGGLDILVNNAGIFITHEIEKTDFKTFSDAWRLTLAVNLDGPAWCCHFAVPMMMQRGGGKIVNITSRGAFRGEPRHPAYGASKAGLNSMSQSLAQQLAPHNIHVFALAPGWVATDMAEAGLNGPQGDAIRAQSPLNRVAEPEEIAWAVAFLASERSSFATGTILDMNGASYLRN